MDRIDKLKGVKVLVVGDVMLDLWETGGTRLGEMIQAKAAPGGAANAAANVESMGGKAALVGVVGNDVGAIGLCEAITAYGIPTHTLVSDNHRPTTTKLYTAKGRKVKESVEPLRQLAADRVFSIVRTLIVHVDAVLLSDYGKGVLSGNMASSLIQLARSHGKPVVVDPFGAHPWRYRGASLIKPNLGEVQRLAGGDVENESPEGIATECVSRLWQEVSCPYLVTMGEAGMMLCREPHRFDRLDAHPSEVVSSVGAGDSVAAACALGLGARMDLLHVAEIANAAGAAAVSQPFTSAVRSVDLRRVAREWARR